MACHTPFTIKNPRPNVTGRGLYIQVPCNKCTECLKRRAKAWMFRLTKEMDNHITSAFVTLTYEDKNLSYTESGLMSLDPRDYTLFMKRLRFEIRKQKVKLSYYMCAEYGGITERPHHHMIILGLPQYYIDNPHRLQNLWKQGHVQVDACHDGAIAYVTGYLNKQKHFSNFGENDDRIPEYSRMSKGIGKSFLTDARVNHMKKHLNPYLTIEDGQKIPLPRYYKLKALSKSEQEAVSEKAKQFAQNNEQWDNPKHQVDTVAMSSLRRKTVTKSKRNII